MFTLQKMKEIAKKENVIFYKQSCPFCIAAEALMKELVKSNIILDYQVYFLDKDFDNETLKELVLDPEFGWKPDSHQNFPSKPQIFLNVEKGKTQYIGGNKEFYNCSWNLGKNNSGKIKIQNKDYQTPNKQNPKRF